MPILIILILDQVCVSGGKKKMVDLVVQSKVRAFVKDNGLNTGGDSLDALEAAVKAMIDKACARAKGNDRKTLMARDC